MIFGWQDCCGMLNLHPEGTFDAQNLLQMLFY